MALIFSLFTIVMPSSCKSLFKSFVLLSFGFLAFLLLNRIYIFIHNIITLYIYVYIIYNLYYINTHQINKVCIFYYGHELDICIANNITPFHSLPLHSLNTTQKFVILM